MKPARSRRLTDSACCSEADMRLLANRMQSLAMRMTFSSSSYDMMTRTGPKTSVLTKAGNEVRVDPVRV